MEMICNKEACTNCKACINVCPKDAIEIIEESNGMCYAKINKEKCINCELCKKTCINNIKIDFKEPQIVYAAWDKDYKSRDNSASGGVATYIQKYALLNDIETYGTIYDKDFEIKFKKIENLNDIELIKNSKYAYSNPEMIYKEIREKLSNKKRVVFVGMPCQVAALKSVVGENINLLTIDIVCHGMPPINYFKEHIHYIKEKYKIKKINNILFRKNNVFNMIIEYDDGKNIILNERIDPYLIGFHQGLLYQESCYECKFARKERVADISLCDFWGIKEKYKDEYNKGISAVMINTKKGIDFWEDISKDIEVHVEDLDTVVKNNGQLRKPYSRHNKRNEFLKLYKKGSFDKILNKLLRVSIMKNRIKENVCVKFVKKEIKGIIRRTVE